MKPSLLTCGGADVALRELLRHRLQVHADADVAGAARTQRSRVHVAELGARRLGAVGVGVGNVVADDVEALARCVQTGETLLEAHGMSFLGAESARVS
jgi:hypothetical protein